MHRRALRFLLMLVPFGLACGAVGIVMMAVRPAKPRIDATVTLSTPDGHQVELTMAQARVIVDVLRTRPSFAFGRPCTCIPSGTFLVGGVRYIWRGATLMSREEHLNHWYWRDDRVAMMAREALGEKVGDGGGGR